MVAEATIGGVFGNTPMLVGLAISIFVMIVFAEYGSIRKKAERGFGLMAAGGLLFFLAATSRLPVLQTETLQMGATYVEALFQVVGWIFVIVGVIWASVDLTKVKK